MTEYVRKHEAHGVPLPVLEILAGCKAIEDSDGSWNGGDVVEFVTEWLTSYGLDVEKPLSYYVGERKDNPLCASLGARPKHRGLAQDVETALANEAEWSEDDEDEEDDLDPLSPWLGTDHDEDNPGCSCGEADLGAPGHDHR